MGTWLLRPTTGVTLRSLLDQLIQFTSKRAEVGLCVKPISAIVQSPIRNLTHRSLLEVINKKVLSSQAEDAGS